MALARQSGPAQTNLMLEIRHLMIESCGINQQLRRGFSKEGEREGRRKLRNAKALQYAELDRYAPVRRTVSKPRGTRLGLDFDMAID